MRYDIKMTEVWMRGNVACGYVSTIINVSSKVAPTVSTCSKELSCKPVCCVGTLHTAAIYANPVLYTPSDIGAQAMQMAIGHAFVSSRFSVRQVQRSSSNPIWILLWQRISLTSRDLASLGPADTYTFLYGRPPRAPRVCQGNHMLKSRISYVWALASGSTPYFMLPPSR